MCQEAENSRAYRNLVWCVFGSELFSCVVSCMVNLCSQSFVLLVSIRVHFACDLCYEIDLL